MAYENSALAPSRAEKMTGGLVAAPPKQAQVPNTFGALSDTIDLCNLIMELAERLLGAVPSEAPDSGKQSLPTGTLNELSDRADYAKRRIQEAKNAIQRIHETI